MTSRFNRPLAARRRVRGEPRAPPSPLPVRSPPLARRQSASVLGRLPRGQAESERRFRAARDHSAWDGAYAVGQADRCRSRRWWSPMRPCRNGSAAPGGAPTPRRLSADRRNVGRTPPATSAWHRHVSASHLPWFPLSASDEAYEEPAQSRRARRQFLSSTRAWRNGTDAQIAWAPVPTAPKTDRKVRQFGGSEDRRRQMRHSAWECGFGGVFRLSLGVTHTGEVAGLSPAAPIGFLGRRKVCRWRLRE